MKTKLFVAIAIFSLPFALRAQEERVDLSVVNRIRSEALENSKVMDHVFYLTDVYGPRLADSPNYVKAAAWAVKTLKEYGLEDAKTEKWGAFGHTWTWSRISVNMIEPQETTLIAVPLAWSPGTDGPMTGEVLVAPMRTVEEGEKYKGKLKGKIVFTQAAPELKLHLEPDAKRYTDADLVSRAMAPEPGERDRFMMGPQRPGERPRNMEDYRQNRLKFIQFLKDEGVLAVVSAGGANGDDGTIFSGPAGSRDAKEPVPPVSIGLASEHYNRIARLVEKNIPVKLEIDLRSKILDEVDGVNVIANLPGGAKKDEVVMVGGHLDSWATGTGATDNAAGAAVAMEAVRILKALNVKMDRTVRIGLWDAEEEGLIGSREYVKAHFADRETMELKPEYSRVSGYFNYDNGTGKIRGIYLQDNDMLRPVFEAWLAPFKDLGATTVSIRRTGGTDHQSFDGVGLPGFQFIQDPLDYGSRTHHTNMDVYDHVQAGDLMQSSAIVASFLYNAATRPQMLPRKPMPKPRRPDQPKPEQPKP